MLVGEWWGRVGERGGGEVSLNITLSVYELLDGRICMNRGHKRNAVIKCLTWLLTWLLDCLIERMFHGYGKNEKIYSPHVRNLLNYENGLQRNPRELEKRK